MNVHAQQPPNKKEGDDGHDNVANPLACGAGFRLFCHGRILAFAEYRILSQTARKDATFAAWLLNREGSATVTLVTHGIRCKNGESVRAFACGYGCIERAHVRGGHLNAVNRCGD